MGEQPASMQRFLGWEMRDTDGGTRNLWVLIGLRCAVGVTCAVLVVANELKARRDAQRQLERARSRRAEPTD